MKKIRLFFITIFLISGLIIFHRSGYLEVPETFALKALSPFGKILNSSAISIKSFLSRITTLKDLQNENVELKKKLNARETEIALLEEAKKENESLRKDLEFRLNSGYKTVSATITMYDPTGARQQVLIDKGEKNGLKKAMAVTSEGFLIGRISEVNQETAKITFLTDPSSAIPVFVQNSTATGIVKGQIGYGLLLEKVPQGDVLKQGQTVISSGLGGDYPKGIIVGKIDKIEKSDNAIFQEASVRPEVNFRMLERVIVIIN